MHRIKWLLLEADLPHKSLIAEILSCPFEDERNFGFNLLDRDAASLRARFIEKISTVEMMVTPFGESSRIETTRYSSTEFHLFLLDKKNQIYLMEVNSPPRSLRSLIDGLAAVAGRTIVSEVQIPLLEIYRVIRGLSSAARVIRVKASQIQLTPNSVARVDVISTKDAALDLQTAFGDSTSMDRIKIERPFGPLMHSIEISKNGLAIVDDEFTEEAIELLRKWLYDRHLSSSP